MTHEEYWAVEVLEHPSRYTADDWYEAMAVLMAERSPA